MKINVRLGAAVLAILGAVTAVVGVAPSQAIASGCYAGTCVGRDPVAYGCSASSTKSDTAYIQGVAVATVWNRYSIGCDANWARAQLTTAGVNRHYTIQVRIFVDGYPQSACYPGPSNTGAQQENCYPLPGYGGSSIVYTDMIDGDFTTYAAVNVFDATNNLVASAVAVQ